MELFSADAVALVDFQDASQQRKSTGSDCLAWSGEDRNINPLTNQSIAIFLRRGFALKKA